jgi:hypothetical protein
MNAPQCYVIRTLPVLFGYNFELHNVTTSENISHKMNNRSQYDFHTPHSNDPLATGIKLNYFTLSMFQSFRVLVKYFKTFKQNAYRSLFTVPLYILMIYYMFRLQVGPHQKHRYNRRVPITCNSCIRKPNTAEIQHYDVCSGWTNKVVT